MDKRITILAGHYGSGKTNIAVNLAFFLKREGKNVSVCDLDIVNPYFRTKDSLEDFEKAGVPREKILIGAAFYLHAYEGVDEKAPLGSRMEKRGRNIPHDNLGIEWTEKWDEKALAAYYVKGNVLMTGDDRRSLIEKRRYIDQQGLGGVIIWELNHDKKNLLLPCLGKGAGADGRTVD